MGLPSPTEGKVVPVQGPNKAVPTVWSTEMGTCQPIMAFYTNIPADAKCIFSLHEYLQKPRRLSHLFPPRSVTVWNAKRIRAGADAFRRGYPEESRKVIAPTKWEDLYEYFDAVDLWHQGPWNLWHILERLSDENDIQAIQGYDPDLVAEINDWVCKWLTTAANRAKLYNWDRVSDIMVIFTEEDHENIGTDLRVVLNIIRSELKYWYGYFRAHPEEMAGDLQMSSGDGEEDSRDSKESAKTGKLPASGTPEPAQQGTGQSAESSVGDSFTKHSEHVPQASASSSQAAVLREGHRDVETGTAITAKQSKSRHQASKSGPVPSDLSFLNLQATPQKAGPSRLPPRSGGQPQQPSPNAAKGNAGSKQQHQPGPSHQTATTPAKARHQTGGQTSGQAATPDDKGWVPKGVDSIHGPTMRHARSDLQKSFAHRPKSSDPNCKNNDREFGFFEEEFAACDCQRCKAASRSIFIRLRGRNTTITPLTNEENRIVWNFCDQFGTTEMCSPRKSGFVARLDSETSALNAVRNGHGTPLPPLTDYVDVSFPFYSKYFKPKTGANSFYSGNGRQGHGHSANGSNSSKASPPRDLVQHRRSEGSQIVNTTGQPAGDNRHRKVTPPSRFNPATTQTFSPGVNPRSTTSPLTLGNTAQSGYQMAPNQFMTFPQFPGNQYAPPRSEAALPFQNQVPTTVYSMQPPVPYYAPPPDWNSSQYFAPSSSTGSSSMRYITGGVTVNTAYGGYNVSRDGRADSSRKSPAAVPTPFPQNVTATEKATTSDDKRMIDQRAMIVSSNANYNPKAAAKPVASVYGQGTPVNPPGGFASYDGASQIEPSFDEEDTGTVIRNKPQPDRSLPSEWQGLDQPGSSTSGAAESAIIPSEISAEPSDLAPGNLSSTAAGPSEAAPKKKSKNKKKSKGKGLQHTDTQPAAASVTAVDVLATQSTVNDAENSAEKESQIGTRKKGSRKGKGKETVKPIEPDVEHLSVEVSQPVEVLDSTPDLDLKPSVPEGDGDNQFNDSPKHGCRASAGGSLRVVRNRKKPTHTHVQDIFPPEVQAGTDSSIPTDNRKATFPNAEDLPRIIVTSPDSIDTSTPVVVTPESTVDTVVGEGEPAQEPRSTDEAATETRGAPQLVQIGNFPPGFDPYPRPFSALMALIAKNAAAKAAAAKKSSSKMAAGSSKEPTSETRTNPAAEGPKDKLRVTRGHLAMPSLASSQTSEYFSAQSRQASRSREASEASSGEEQKFYTAPGSPASSSGGGGGGPPPVTPTPRPAEVAGIPAINLIGSTPLPSSSRGVVAPAEEEEEEAGDVVAVGGGGGGGHAPVQTHKKGGKKGKGKKKAAATAAAPGGSGSGSK